MQSKTELSQRPIASPRFRYKSKVRSSDWADMARSDWPVAPPMEFLLCEYYVKSHEKVADQTLKTK